MVVYSPNLCEEGKFLGYLVNIFIGDVVKRNPCGFEGRLVFQEFFPYKPILLIFLIYQGQVKDLFYGLCGRGDAHHAISFTVGDVGLTSACGEIGIELAKSIEVEFEWKLGNHPCVEWTTCPWSSMSQSCPNGLSMRKLIQDCLTSPLRDFWSTLLHGRDDKAWVSVGSPSPDGSPKWVAISVSSFGSRAWSMGS